MYFYGSFFFPPDNPVPLCLMPEGCRGSGQGLLSFRDVPFKLDAAVQPVSLLISYSLLGILHGQLTGTIGLSNIGLGLYLDG